MHDECRYVIEDIIDRVKKLEAEYLEANRHPPKTPSAVSSTQLFSPIFTHDYET